MHARTRLEAVRAMCWAWAWGWGWVVCAATPAPTAPSKTLGELIAQAKREQAKGPQTPSPAKPSQPARKLGPPMLWTLSGANHQLVAEVLDNGTMHVLRLHEGERQFGRWTVDRYSTQGLWVVARDPKTGAFKEPMFLVPPSAGMPLSHYLPGLPQAPAPVATGGPLPNNLAGLPPMPDNFTPPKP